MQIDLKVTGKCRLYKDVHTRAKAVSTAEALAPLLSRDLFLLDIMVNCRSGDLSAWN